jgi:ribosomal protein S19
MKQKKEPLIEKHLRQKGLEMKELRLNDVSEQSSDSEILQEMLSYYVAIHSGIWRSPSHHKRAVFLK